MRHLSLLPAVAAAVLAAGCGPQVTAPSLDVRPIERQPVALPAEASEPSVPADPVLMQQLATAEQAARTADARFATVREETERAVSAAAGTPAGSERWTAAQQALSALAAARGPVREAAATVEALRADPANGGSGARAAIDAAAARIGPLEEAEADAVARLATRLPQG